MFGRSVRGCIVVPRRAWPETSVNEAFRLSQVRLTRLLYLGDRRVVLRLSIGQTHTEERHVERAWQVIQDAAGT